MEDQEVKGDGVKAFRIAVRRQKGWIHAYWAQPNTMADAIHIASVSGALVDAEPLIYESFLIWLKMVAQAGSKSLLGVDIERFTEEPARDEGHEKR
jgi:hypothetical protein